LLRVNGHAGKPTRTILLCALLIVSLNSVGAVETYTFKQPEDKARYYQITNELRCPRCQNQAIADSDSLVAQDLRWAIYQQIESGQTNRQIIDFMVQRYGDFVLYRPPFNKVTLLLWVGPIIILILGLLVVFRVVRHYRTLPVESKKNNNGTVS